MSTAALMQTPLHDWHKAHGGRLVEFGGWSMPVQYTSITEEHEAVRKRAGLFDISHMGRLRFDGPGALGWLQRVTTNDVGRLAPGRIQYSLVCNESGGIIDDVLVYRLTDGDAFGLVCNASNREQVVAQFNAHNDNGDDATMADSTRETAMIAVQGPSALWTVQQVFDGPPLAEQKYYSHASGQVLGTGASASRTGYTGEDGFELIVHTATSPRPPGWPCSRPASPGASAPAASGPATPCGSRPRCRSTATNSMPRPTPSPPASARS